MQYILNLARTLKWHYGDRIELVLLGIGEAPEVDSTIADQLVWEPRPIRRRDRALRWLTFQALGRTLPLDRAMRRARVDFIFPYFPGPLPAVPSGTWIPDLQHLDMPEMFSRREVFMRNRHFSRIARYAQCVVVSSETARDAVAQRYPLSKGKLEVLRFSTFPEESWFEGDPGLTCRKHGVPEKFFLASNQFWKHKNHELLFSAMELLKGRDVTLVCTGRIHDYRSPQFAEQLVAGLERRGLGSHVRCLGVIPREDQIQLMRQAVAVVQPSLFEGWSTVVEDARTLGKPIVLSDIPVHLEQDPPDATFFARHSKTELADALHALWRRTPGIDPGAQQATLARALQRSRLFAEDFMRLLPEAT